MAKFLTGNELNSELEKIFELAESNLILISPYIKLHERYASTLKAKKNNDKLEIIIVFGKNEEDVSRSMRIDDLNFFKEFPNIEIRYEKRLHAKYYSNENTSILTSMNLYSYSQDNNIEAGIMTEGSLFGDFTNKLLQGEETVDTKALKYFERVIKQSDLIYKRIPKYESILLGISKKYKCSEIVEDKIEELFTGKIKTEKSYSRPKNDFPKQTNNQKGYCIRTRKEISFNIKKPLCNEAYESWAKYSNKDFPEKFCHFSGDPTNGEITFAKPILTKHWKKAKEVHGF
ncbi:MAG: hypothetical protein A2033_01860 [Bacteroidetes bacterium GWA2_31_9]|nr:MAG: hypothetical protein A2033_01860 [Bacteroidetes bacterium GWA2_31_9]